jgi:DNA replication protein DnaC
MLHFMLMLRLYYRDLKRQMLGRFLGPELVGEAHSLILEGPPGTGKTYLCIAIAYKAIQNGALQL